MARTQFDWYTYEARDAVVQSEVASREMGCGDIETEHLLLGMLSVRCLANTYLKTLGINHATILAEVPRCGPFTAAVDATSLPFSMLTKRVLELALHRAIAWNHPQLGTEHLLFALTLEGEGLGGATLSKVAGDRLRIRQGLLRYLHEHAVK